MQALAVFPAQRTLKVIDAPKPPPPSAREVCVQTLEVGICGTDKEIAAFQYGTPPPDSDYLILGHECLGKVVEIGPEVTDLSVGDLVVPRVRRPCPHEICAPCRAQRSDYCITGDFRERGILKQHGFGCELWVEREEYLHRLPHPLRAVGVLTEPLTIAEKALATVAVVQSRLPGMNHARRGLVIGSGPVGLLGVMAMRRAGFTAHVYARSRPPSLKADLAQAWGAGYLSSQDVPPAGLPEAVGAPDLVYEAAGASHTAFEVLQVLGPNGVFVFTGVPGRKEPLEIEGGTLMKRLVLHNQVALGTVNAGGDAFEAAVQDLAWAHVRWPGTLERLITHRHEPEAAAAALREGLRGGIKHVIKFADLESTS